MKPKSDTTICTNKRNAMDSERDRNKSASLGFCLVSLQIDFVHMGVFASELKKTDLRLRSRMIWRLKATNESY